MKLLLGKEQMRKLLPLLNFFKGRFLFMNKIRRILTIIIAAAFAVNSAPRLRSGLPLVAGQACLPDRQGYLSPRMALASGDALRPMAAHTDQYASKIEADMFFGMATNEANKDSVPVLRNNVPGKEKGQVVLRVCEISDLNNAELQGVIDALNAWLYEYRFPELSHGEFVSRIIRNLEMRLNPGIDLFDKSRRIFIAISKPDTNGLGRADVEGIVE